MADADGTTAAGAAVAAPPDLPSPPPLQPDSTSSPPPSTPTCATPATATATAGTPSLPDTPASAADDTPLSDADAAADIHAFSDAAAATPVFSDAAAESLDGDEQTIPSSAKKRMILPPPPPPAKKAKKKSSNVWTKSTSRKGKKKPKQPPAPGGGGAAPEDAVLITPAPRLLADRSDDAPHAPVLLSRVHKSEKVELSEDRLTAGSAKGYRMVRATRGVAAGAWYFEIKVAHLGATGHTRLGWATNKGDLQAPVGYDAHGFGYRDIDGSKVHKALREKYGSEGYSEGDVIGFYINLPDGQLYEPKPPKLVLFKGQRYFYSVDGKDEPPNVVPGSEISFFKNGICQGTAFTDLFGGRYYPAASMYTLPNQPNCEVRFNFGPDFEFFPQDFGGRPIPRPVSEVPYHGYDQKNSGPAENGIAEKQS